MHRLAASEDLSFFAGVDLLQVCVGKDEIVLNFERGSDDGVTLTVLSEFAVEHADGALARFADPVAGAPSLLTYLSDRVTAAEATPEGHLRIRFKGGRSILVFDTNDPQESFLITSGRREIIV